MDEKPTRDELLAALQAVLEEGHGWCSLPRGECAWWRARNLLAGIPPGLSVGEALTLIEEKAPFHTHQMLRIPGQGTRYFIDGVEVEPRAPVVLQEAITTGVDGRTFFTDADGARHEIQPADDKGDD
jgi:hypothetical protein